MNDVERLHDAAGHHPSFRNIALTTLVLTGLLCILVPWAIVSARGAASASELVASNSAVLSCRAEFAARIDEAQVDLDFARAELDKARAVRQQFETDLVVAAVAGDQATIEQLLADRAETTIDALQTSIAKVERAVESKEVAVAARSRAVKDSKDNPAAFVRACETNR